MLQKLARRSVAFFQCLADAADAADFGRRGVAAAYARGEYIAVALFCVLEGRLPAFEKAVIEVHFSAGHLVFKFQPQTFQS